MQTQDYRKILLRELESRKSRNASYNIGSFARLLKLSPSRLSEILRKKVGLSVKKAMEISNTLNLSDDEARYFTDLVCVEHSRSPSEKAKAKLRLEKYNADFSRFDHEIFESIADWHHMAITEIISMDEKVTNIEISNIMKIELSKINNVIDRLLRLNIIEKTSKGYKVCAQNRGTKAEIPSDAIKQLNKQYLTKASEEIYLQDITNRDYSIVFFGFNKEQLKLAKERIRDFRRSFMKEFESSIGKDAVYCMGVQLFEVADLKNKKNKPKTTSKKQI